MEYITQFPNSLIYVGLDGLIVTVPGTAVLNNMGESEPISGYWVDPKDAGDPSVLTNGDTVAVTTPGGETSGTYVGSATISNSAFALNLALAKIVVQVNPIQGDVLQSGNDFYFISEQEFSEHRLRATVSLELNLGLTTQNVTLADVAVSDLVSAISSASLGLIPASSIANIVQQVMNASTLTLALNTGASKPLTNPSLLCFCAGTLIMTARGRVPVEQLEAGDLVLTFGGEFEPVLWIGHQMFIPETGAAGDRHRPVRISAGALAPGCPDRDLLLSQQHRVLLSSELTWALFDVGEVLVAAGKLTGLPGIALDERPGPVHYFHLLLQEHQAVLADGAWCESLYSGPEAMRTLPASAREFIAEPASRLYRSELHPEPAFPILTGRSARRLVQRHLRRPGIALTRPPAPDHGRSRTAPVWRDLVPSPEMLPV